MAKRRLDQELVARYLVSSRSQAESYIKLGTVKVNGTVIKKSGTLVSDEDKISLVSEQYVSRAGLKLASVAKALKLEFKDKVVLDVGSSTGGFTDYSLQHGAKKVLAVDVGTDQLHPSLHNDPRIELYEKTDIRKVRLGGVELRIKNQELSKEKPELDSQFVILHSVPDLILIDVSFISLRDILPSIHRLCGPGTVVVAMVKPQFEAGDQVKHKGVIKNDKMRRDTLKDFEIWVQKLFRIVDKSDSEVAGAKGNRERFYLLEPARQR